MTKSVKVLRVEAFWFVFCEREMGGREIRGRKEEEGEGRVKGRREGERKEREKGELREGEWEIG